MGRFRRTDIPLADRLLMEKFNTIREHRNDAARTALKIACVALNNTEGHGLIRLVRFAEEQQWLTEEYYRDPEVEEKHLNDRLQEIGFICKDGRLLGAIDQDGKPVKASSLPEGMLPEGGTYRMVPLWSGWISVREDKPRNRRDILMSAFWHEKWQTLPGRYDPDSGEWHCLTNAGFRTDLSVDFWREMPEPPAGGHV